MVLGLREPLAGAGQSSALALPGAPHPELQTGGMDHRTGAGSDHSGRPKDGRLEDRARAVREDPTPKPPRAAAQPVSKVASGCGLRRWGAPEGRGRSPTLPLRSLAQSCILPCCFRYSAGAISLCVPSSESKLTTALDDRYRIERELGANGMATVWLAQDLRHDRKVAVKVLRPELAAVIGAERFLAEIKTTANLQHPHILPLFDSGEAESFLYYVMPFIEGESLRERLNREKQLPIGDAVRIAKEVASALD